MEIRLNISEKVVFVLLIITAIVSAIGITMAAPPDPGHAWSEIECAGCVTASNLADSSVTAAKANFNYAGSSSKGGPATSAASASSVPWTGITGRPAGLDDGDQDTVPSCTWTGWGGTSCLSCSWGCDGSITTLQGYCSGGRMTQVRTINCCVSCTTNPH